MRPSTDYTANVNRLMATTPAGFDGDPATEDEQAVAYWQAMDEAVAYHAHPAGRAADWDAVNSLELSEADFDECESVNADAEPF